MSNITYDTNKCQEFLKVPKRLQIELVNYLIRSSNLYELVMPSRETIAQAVGCSLSTVGNHLRDLKRIGLIEINKEGRHRRSSIYKVNVLLFKYVNVFKDKFRALKKIIHLTIKYPKFSAIQRCIKRAFSSDVLTKFLGKIYPPLRRTLKSLKKKSIYILTRERETVLSRAERRDLGLKIKFRRGRSSMDSKMTISLALKDVTKRLKLTKWGQIKLICFPEEAIRHALQYYTSKTSFNTFFFKASDYCKDNNIEPDWVFYYEMAKKYDMPKEPKFVSNDIPKTPVFEVKKKEYHSKDNAFRRSQIQGDLKERYKGDKGYENRVLYFQQFKPQFLEE